MKGVYSIPEHTVENQNLEGKETRLFARDCMRDGLLELDEEALLSWNDYVWAKKRKRHPG
jgi:hypothetical protein